MNPPGCVNSKKLGIADSGMSERDGRCRCVCIFTPQISIFSYGLPGGYRKVLKGSSSQAGCMLWPRNIPGHDKLAELAKKQRNGVTFIIFAPPGTQILSIISRITLVSKAELR